MLSETYTAAFIKFLLQFIQLPSAMPSVLILPFTFLPFLLPPHRSLSPILYSNCQQLPYLNWIVHTWVLPQNGQADSALIVLNAPILIKAFQVFRSVIHQLHHSSI